MALTQTQLSSAITATATEFRVSSLTGLPASGTGGVNWPLQIDGEVCVLTGVSAAGWVQVRARGSDGTAAVAHVSGAPVYVSSEANDFPIIQPDIGDYYTARGSVHLRAGSGKLAGLVEPVSGPNGTGVGTAAGGSTYMDTNRKVLYVNETNAVSPYWTPVSPESQSTLISFYCDFKDFQGKALADTAASVTLTGSGLRIFGQGIAETDSGLVVASDSGCVKARLTTTDEAEHLVALSFGSIAGGTLYAKPASWGPMVIDATVFMVSALTLRNFFMGFVGTVADALDPPVTGDTETITLVQDNLAGLFYDSRLTLATTLFAPHNKANEAADLTAAECVTNPATVFSAAGTDVRFRVEVDRTGTLYGFVNKVLVAKVTSALSTSVAVAPVLLVGSTSSAVKSMDVRRIAAWSRRI